MTKKEMIDKIEELYNMIDNTSELDEPEVTDLNEVNDFINKAMKIDSLLTDIMGELHDMVY